MPSAVWRGYRVPARGINVLGCLGLSVRREADGFSLHRNHVSVIPEAGSAQNLRRLSRGIKLESAHLPDNIEE